VKKTAASPPKEGGMSASIIFLQVGAYAPTCKKIMLALKRASPPPYAAIFIIILFTEYCYPLSAVNYPLKNVTPSVKNVKTSVLIKIKMNNRHFKNKEKSPLMMALGILLIVGIIFYLFKKDKKEMPQEPVIPPPSPKDFI
jgi:hypothetical protein